MHVEDVFVILLYQVDDLRAVPDALPDGDEIKEGRISCSCEECFAVTGNVTKWSDDEYVKGHRVYY